MLLIGQFAGREKRWIHTRIDVITQVKQVYRHCERLSSARPLAYTIHWKQNTFANCTLISNSMLNGVGSLAVSLSTCKISRINFIHYQHQRILTSWSSSHTCMEFTIKTKASQRRRRIGCQRWCWNWQRNRLQSKKWWWKIHLKTESFPTHHFVSNG